MTLCVSELINTYHCFVSLNTHTLLCKELFLGGKFILGYILNHISPTRPFSRLRGKIAK